MKTWMIIIIVAVVVLAAVIVYTALEKDEFKGPVGQTTAQCEPCTDGCACDQVQNALPSG
jgi:hypothetical protein